MASAVAIMYVIAAALSTFLTPSSSLASATLFSLTYRSALAEASSSTGRVTRQKTTMARNKSSARLIKNDARATLDSSIPKSKSGKMKYPAFSTIGAILFLNFAGG